MHDLATLAHAPLDRQAGFVTRVQLREAGLGSRQIDGLVVRRRLVPVAPGLYRPAGHPVPPEGPAWAAVLATGGLLTGEHLFALLDIEGGSLRGPPTVLVAPGTPAPRGLAVQLLVGDPAGTPRHDIRGLPAVALPAAVTEYAAGAALEDVRRVVDSARWRGLLRIPALLADAGSRPMGHLGAQKVRWMHEAGFFADESQGERTLDRALGTLGLLFRRQVDDIVPGRRLDRYCDLARLALEYDGRQGERDLDRDAVKDLDALAVGVLALHVTGLMIQPGRVRGTVERIARLVDERGRTRPWTLA